MEFSWYFSLLYSTTKPSKRQELRVFQNVNFPASCRISSPVFKYFTTTVLAATATEALLKVTFLLLENRNHYNH